MAYPTWSLRTRISLGVVLVATLVLAISGVLSYLATRSSLQAQDRALQAARSERLRDVVPALVWESDPKLSVVLDAEMANAQLVGLLVFDGDRLLAGRHRLDDGSVVAIAAPLAIDGRREMIPLTYEVNGVRRDIGHVETFVTDRLILAALREQVVAKIREIVLMDIVLVAALSATLAAIVLRPLRQLKSALGHALNSETVVLPETRYDEIGEVVQGYNRITRKLDEDLKRHIAMEAALRAAKEQSEQAHLAKVTFLSRMSHELRTPLNAVIGFSQLLRAECAHELDQSRLLWIDHIEKAGQHLLAMIDEIMDLSRVAAGSLRLDLRPVDLRREIQVVVEMLQGQALAAGVSLEIQAEAGVPPAQADATRVRQVLINLASNAIKYTPSGGRARLMLASVPPDRVRLTVADNGLGISAEQQKQMFDPFNRLGQETSNRPGTGLGLTITKSLVELMHGDLKVESALGVGSEFSVLLPAATTSVADASTGQAPVPSATKGADIRVLYVEDNEVNAEVMAAMLLQRLGVVLDVQPTAASGLQAALQGHYDLILLDLHLPDMGGIELLGRLKDTPETADVPVIVVSADVTPQAQEAALQAGAVAYLGKPFDIGVALAEIDRVIAQYV